MTIFVRSNNTDGLDGDVVQDMLYQPP
jgi:hypothetical protein